MNILFLSKSFYPHVGGVERHVYEVSKLLVESGHTVTVITERDQLSTYECIDGIVVHRINGGHNNFFKKFKIWYRLLEKIHLIRDADIVHAHDVYFWYFPFRLIFFTKKSYVTFHGYEGYPVRFQAIVIRKLSELLSNGNICVGAFIKKWYTTRPTYIIYGGIRMKSTYPVLPLKKKLSIAFLGRFESENSVSLYAQTLQKLKDQEIPFSFQAFGQGSEQQVLEKFGSTSISADIEKDLKSADIVFSSSYLSMLEALSHKKLVVALYTNPLKKDYLLKSPFKNHCIVANSADEAVNALMSFVQLPFSQQKDFLNTGADWAITQTWEKVVRTYLYVWKKEK